ncbi:unnamed protein product [Parnassius apollo]|uniref:(apollo) hypothetical protein n=1 Tax=Parnassius apollo TaxID=110799 RepID=A0A8S3XL92_PARAO|nr:unnamed protein product [Parnassius apollo]
MMCISIGIKTKSIIYVDKSRLSDKTLLSFTLVDNHIFTYIRGALINCDLLNNTPIRHYEVTISDCLSIGGFGFAETQHSRSY